jgi:hypothetical protein
MEGQSMSWKTDNLDRAEALNVQARELRAQVAAGDATDAELAR